MNKSPDTPKALHRTSIGGQALIEGVMMQGTIGTAMAVRLHDGTIDTETFPENSRRMKKWYRKFPFIRGCFNMINSLTFGYKCMMLSAEKSAPPEEKSESAESDKKMNPVMNFLLGTAMVFGVVISIFLFMWLPSFIVSAIANIFPDIAPFRTIFEGVLKIIIFIGYLALVSLNKDIKRTFQYHGAEHKTIACYEAGDSLTPENAKKYSRFHPRCGTSFLFLVMVISIIIFSLPIVPWTNTFLRVGIKLLFLPIVVSLSYEVIKIAGRHDNWFTRIISAPGLALQKLTTREPDDSQLEVAIAAINAIKPEDINDDKW